MDLRRAKRGSRAYRPRKRAKTQIPEMFWPEHEQSRVLGFAGYKVGMITLSYIDYSEGPTKGQEIFKGATVLEVPPIYVYGIRIYKNKKIAKEILTSDKTKLKLLGIKKLSESEDREEPNGEDCRLLVFTQPKKTKIGKKHIERFELGIGGKNLTEKFNFSKGLLGKELSAKDVFKSGDLVDVVGITKGKGFQGIVKRYGTSLQRPKATGKRRHLGTLGQWTPSYILYTVPRAGQMGYHKRTELNKTILKISGNVDEINPLGGFPHYGFVKNDFLIIKGSLPGPVKRLVKLRLARDAAQHQHKEIKLTTNVVK